VQNSPYVNKLSVFKGQRATDYIQHAVNEINIHFISSLPMQLSLSSGEKQTQWP